MNSGMITHLPIVALLAGTGMFPFATFHSELMILNAAVIAKHYVLAVLTVACLGVVFIGIARIVLDVVHGQPTEPVLAKKENGFMNVVIALAVVALIALGLWLPSPIEKMIHNAVAITGM